MILSAFSLKMEILNKAIIDILSLMHSEPQSRDPKPSTHQDQPESRHLAHCGVGVDLSLFNLELKFLKKHKHKYLNLKKNTIKKSF